MDNSINSSTKSFNSKYAKRIVNMLVICLSGLVVAAIIFKITDLRAKYIFGTLLIIPLAFTFAGNLRKFMLGIFFFLIPVALNISLFQFNPDLTSVAHHGGAQPSMQIWISSLPLIILFFLWVFDVAPRRKKIRFTPIGVPAILFIGLCCFSLFNSTRLDLSAAHLLRMIFFYLTYLYIVNNVTDLKTLRFVVTVLLIGFIFQSLLAMAQYWLHLPFSIEAGSIMPSGGFVHHLDVGYVYRVQGTVGWPNTFGLYIAMMIPLVLSVFLSNGFSKGKIAFIALCLGFVALLITFSRGAWFATSFGVFVTLYILVRRRLIRVKILPVVFLIFPIILFSVLVLGGQVYQRVTISEEAAVSDRFELNWTALEMIKAHPFTGVGLNTFTEVIEDYDKTGMSSYLRLPAHNSYLLIASETGLVSALVFIWIAVVVILYGYRYSGCIQQNIAPLMAGCVGGFVAFMLQSLVGGFSQDYISKQLFWVFAGLIFAAYSHISVKSSD